jgi:MFS transporter, DHA3 family, macrolide efflux protein
MAPSAAVDESRSIPAHESPWNRNFRLLWAGNLLSELGNVTTSMTALIWIQRTTESSLALGWVLAAAAIPGVLLTPLGGALADRRDRRAILVICDLLAGAAMLVLSAAFLVEASVDVRLQVVAATLVSAGILGGLFRPAVSACIPDAVPAGQLDAANGWYGSASSLARITGHAAAGAAYTLVGPAALFALDAVTFLLSGWLSSRMSLASRSRAPGARSSWSQDLREVLGYVGRNRGLRQLLVGSSLLHFLLNPVTVLLPFFAERTLGVGPVWLGYLYSSFAAGTAVGFMAAGPLSARLGSRRMSFAAVVILEALLLTVLGLTRSVGLALVLVLGLGVSFGLAAVVVQTVIQLRVPGPLRGRVFGMLITVNAALVPFSLLIAGALGELGGRDVGAVFLASGLAMSGVVAWLVTRSQLGALLASSPAEVPEPTL